MLMTPLSKYFFKRLKNWLADREPFSTQPSPPPLSQFRNHPNLDLCIADSFRYFSSLAPVLWKLSSPCRQRTRIYRLSFHRTGKYIPIDPVDYLDRVC
jgi:hypothetical protein